MFIEKIERLIKKAEKRNYTTYLFYMSNKNVDLALSYCNLVPLEDMTVTYGSMDGDGIARIRMIVRNSNEMSDTIRMLKQALKTNLHDDRLAIAISNGKDWGE